MFLPVAINIDHHWMKLVEDKIMPRYCTLFKINRCFPSIQISYLAKNISANENILSSMFN